MLVRLLVFFTLALTAFAVPEQEVREIPANEFAAYIFPLAGEHRIAIRRFDPRNLAELSLFSPDSQHGGHIEEITRVRL